MKTARALAFATIAVFAHAHAATALPTMVRLGYADCAACHVSPQGGGALTVYGRGIDRSQSLRGGEYTPSDDALTNALSVGGRITQDFRLLLRRQATWAPNGTRTDVFRPRLMYRNVADIAGALRASATFTAETTHAPRPARAYDPPTQAATLSVNTALLHYRVNETIEIAAGKDQLPSGINIPDLAVFIKSRNRLGYYDAPAQLKMFWNSKRYHVTPFAFAPGGNERAGEAETGTGALAEVDVLGAGRTMAGVSVLKGVSESGSRRVLGLYVRLGFGRWGVLGEHDMTTHDRDALSGAHLPQSTTYAQLFVAMREWLVASAIAERARVTAPFDEKLTAGAFELSARLASQATLGVAARVQHDERSGRTSPSLVVQAAFKTIP
jgi:hypothetical protein